LSDKEIRERSAKETQRKCEGNATEVRRKRNGSAKETQAKCEGNAMALNRSAKETQGVSHNLALSANKAQ